MGRGFCPLDDSDTGCFGARNNFEKSVVVKLIIGTLSSVYYTCRHECPREQEEGCSGECRYFEMTDSEIREKFFPESGAKDLLPYRT